MPFLLPATVRAQAANGTVEVRRFLPVKPLSRAQRPAGIVAALLNNGDTPIEASATLILPAGVEILGDGTTRTAPIDANEAAEVSWEVKAEAGGLCELRLEVAVNGAAVTSAVLPMNFLPPLEMRSLPYIPKPKPLQKGILIGAHHCPLWEKDYLNAWSQLIKHPERTPALGFYAQENPEVSDWETKWAVEHGIDFFIYCWYRTSQGGPVEHRFGSAIHDGLFMSRFVDQMKFTIMWENQSRGTSGVADEADLKENLFPFWMAQYFKHPSYLKVDNKPVLFIYRPEFLSTDLGSVENVAKAFEWMRQACRDEGFDGLWILGEYRGLDPNHLRLMKQLGLDYSFAYVWPLPDSPPPEVAIQKQLSYMRQTQELGILPQVLTASQAWSGWADEGSIWKIPPDGFKTLLEGTKAFAATLPPEELGSRMVLLDNWNEWGEGHYIAPYREYGFGYLDAVREVFTDAPEAHVDLIPEDIGFGLYDAHYKIHTRREAAIKALTSKKVRKDGATHEGLVAWWAFDEEPDTPIAFDYSGNGLGGKLCDAGRAEGIDGQALVCDGGCVVVPPDPALSPLSALTVECWVNSTLDAQGNTWFLNHIFSGGTDTGYRMGILNGLPCFEVPQTSFSHHLTAPDPLPTGQWVHLAGTFDGKTQRIYVNGEEKAVMERLGPPKPNEFKLVLGNFDENHAAHFHGLLDEVKLYNRALSPEEVRECVERQGIAR